MELALALAIGVLIGFFITKYFKDKELEILKDSNERAELKEEKILSAIEASVNSSTSKAQKPYFDELTKKEQRIATAQQELQSQKDKHELKEKELMRMHSEANIKKSYSNITRGANAEKIMNDIILSCGFVENKNVEFRKKQEGINGTPDATLIYPRNRKVICDSKSPLDKFDEIIDAGQSGDENRVDALKAEFGTRILDHINWLSDKSYHKAKGSMNFTIMFLPSETHERMARESVLLHQKDLDEYARSKKIVVVSPNTFYPYVEQINELWREHENLKSADETLSVVKDAFKAVRIISEKITNLVKKTHSTAGDADDLIRSFNSTFKRAAEKVKASEFSDQNVDKVIKDSAEIIEIKDKKN